MSDLGPDTLIALAAMAWADGVMKPEEAQGIRNAARQLALSLEGLEQVEAAIAQPVHLTDVETVRMSRFARLFTYSVSSWIIRIDGSVSAQEQQALELLGDRLGLSSVARERAARATAALPIGLGANLDIPALRSRLSAGLSQIGDE